MNERIRSLIAEEKKCIGCRACTSICPEGRIHFSEEGSRRNIQFPGSCSLNCELCALACPEKAITFVLREKENMEENIDGKLEGERMFLSSDRIVSLELIPCRKCGAAFATLGEVEKVRKAVSEKVTLLSGGDSWMELCLECRKTTFREKEAGTLLRTRRF